MDSDASEEHMAQEAFREKSLKYNRIVDKTVSNSFVQLLSSSHQDRLKAATTIVKYLFVKQDQVEEICSELSYVLRRLIRGVGTPREDARIGFYATLVSLLTTFPQITTAKVLEFIKKELVVGAQTQAEQSEEKTAQVLTYGAVIQSGTLKLANITEQLAVLTSLTTLASTKDYLPSFAYSFLIQFAEMNDSKHFRRVVWPVVEPLVSLPWNEQTHNTLHFLLWASERYPAVVNSNFFTKYLETELVCKSSLKHWCSLLMRPARRSLLQHPVYEAFCRRLVSTDNVVKFSAVLDLYLANQGGSGMSDMAAATLFHFTATHLQDKTQMCSLLGAQFVQLLMRYGGRKPKLRDQVNEKLDQGLDAVVKAMNGAPDDAIVDFISCLLYVPGNLHNEFGTSYRVVRQLIPLLGAPGVTRLLAIHRGVLEDSAPCPAGNAARPPAGRATAGMANANKAAANGKAAAATNGKATWREKDRVSAAQAYTQLLGHAVLQPEQKVRAEMMRPLIALGFFKDASLGPASATQIKACFFKTLDQRTPNLDSLRALLSDVVHELDKMLSSKQSQPALRQNLGEKALVAWKRMRVVVAELSGKKAVAAAPLFHTMFLHLGLLLLEDHLMATEALQELDSCYLRVKGAAHARPVMREGELESGEPEWVEVAVELLLSLLSNASHLLRRLVLCVFPHLTAHLTPSALQQVLSVLDTKSDRTLLRPAGDSGSESEDEGDEEGEDEEEGEEDVEEDEEEEGEEDWEDSEDGAREPVNEQLKVALRKALWPSGAVVTGGDDDEDVDLELGEEEGKELNAALENAFREFRASRPERKKGAKQSKPDEALMHFRARVLDLLEIALAATPPMSTCLDALPPLLQLLQFCVQDAHQKPLENRTRVCLRKLSATKAWRDAEDVTAARIAALLDSVLSKGERTAPLYLDMLGETAGIAAFLARCSAHIGGNEDADGEDAVVLRYTQALNEFATRRECLHNVGLFKTVLRLPWLGNWSLAAELVRLVFAPVRVFKQQQAIALLTDFYRNKPLTSADGGAQRLAAITRRLLSNSRKLFTANADPESAPLKARFAEELATLLRRVHKERSEGGAEDAKRWRKLAVALAAFAEVRGAKGKTLAAIQDICSASSVELDMSPIAAAAKNAAQPKAVNGKPHGSDGDDDENDADEQPGKGKKRKDRKLKKASRELRQAAMSEGFTGSHFGADFETESARADQAEREEESGDLANGDASKKKKKRRKDEGEASDVHKKPKKHKSKDKRRQESP